MPKDFQQPDFPRITRFLNKMGSFAHEFTSDFNREEAERMLAVVKSHMDRQDLPWVPLSPPYLRRKERQGLSTDIWKATETLYNQLKVVYDSNTETYYVGGEEGEVHGPSGLEVNHLIDIHERGRPPMGIPARPLFEPSSREARKGANSRFFRKSRDFMFAKVKRFLGGTGA